MATLKNNDLSVGDWVQVLLRKCDYDEPDTFKAKVLTVVNNSVGVGYDNSGIVMSVFVEDLHPIPITAEILEKNGFEKPFMLLMSNTWLNDSVPKVLFKDKDLQLLMFRNRIKFLNNGIVNNKITFSSSFYCYNILPKQIIMIDK